jgi:intein-encoded DNA endonuclease-like protein
MERICLICGKNFKVKPVVVKKGGGKFCSNKCKGLYRSKYLALKKKLYKDKIIREYLNGKSVVEISKLIPVSDRYIQKILAENNINLFGSKGFNKLNQSDYFSEIDTEEKAYWLGFIYADGYIAKNENRLAIVLSIKDKEHLKKFADIFGKQLIEIKKLNKKNYEQCGIFLYSERICNDLRNILNSDNIFNVISEELYGHFIRGFFDGDGSIIKLKDKNKFMAEFAGKSFFLNLLQIILAKYDINSKIYKYSTTTKVEKLRIFKISDLTNLYKFLYKNASIYLERKKRKFDEFYFWRVTLEINKRGLNTDVWNSVKEEEGQEGGVANG